MSTLSNLAKEYADYIRLNKENPIAISEIADRINGLTYTTSGKTISLKDKQELIDLIENNLKKRDSASGRMIHEAEDSTQIIKLINMLRSKTTGK